jgi:hypothetical protein
MALGSSAVNTLEFLEKIIGHITWPVFIFATLLLLRTHMRSILLTLKTLKLPGGVEIEMRERLDEIREDAASAGVILVPSSSIDEGGRAIQLAQEFPQAAIMDAWIELERILRDLVAPYAGGVNTREPIWRTLERMKKQGLLNVDEVTISILYNLRELRNEVVHAKKESVTPGEALEFVDLAQAVGKRLEEARRSQRPEWAEIEP